MEEVRTGKKKKKWRQINFVNLHVVDGIVNNTSWRKCLRFMISLIPLCIIFSDFSQIMPGLVLKIIHLVIRIHF